MTILLQEVPRLVDFFSFPIRGGWLSLARHGCGHNLAGTTWSERSKEDKILVQHYENYLNWKYYLRLKMVMSFLRFEIYWESLFTFLLQKLHFDTSWTVLEKRITTSIWTVPVNKPEARWRSGWRGCHSRSRNWVVHGMGGECGGVTAADRGYYYPVLWKKRTIKANNL